MWRILIGSSNDPASKPTRNSTSLWPSKIGTRRGDVIKDAQLQNPSRCGHCLIAASMYHSAGNMMSAREQVLGCNCQQSGVLSFGTVAAKVAARERPTSKFWEQLIIEWPLMPERSRDMPNAIRFHKSGG